MKKIFTFLIMFLALSIGEVNAKQAEYNVRTKMLVSQDSTMNYELNLTLNSEFLFKYDVNVEDIFSQSTYEISLGNKGYVVAPLVSNINSGIQITKSFPDLKAISTSKKFNIELSEIENEKFKDTTLFQKKSGIVYDKYIANFTFDYTDVKATKDITKKELEKMMNLSYEVNLPVAASKYNADVINDDKNNLIWNFEIGKVNDVNFEFKMVNITNLIIMLGIGTVIVIAMIVLIVKKTSGKIDELKETMPKKEKKIKKEKVNKRVFNNGMTAEEEKIEPIKQPAETNLKQEHVAVMTDNEDNKEKIDLMAPMQPQNNNMQPHNQFNNTNNEPEIDNDRQVVDTENQVIYPQSEPIMPTVNDLEDEEPMNIFNQQPINNPQQHVEPNQNQFNQQINNNVQQQNYFNQQPSNNIQPQNLFNQQPTTNNQQQVVEPNNNQFNQQQPQNVQSLFNQQPANAPQQMNQQQPTQQAPDYTDIFNQTFKDDK